MVIDCPECTARFQVPDDKFKPGMKVRCSRCKHVFRADGPAPEPEQARRFRRASEPEAAPHAADPFGMGDMFGPSGAFPNPALARDPEPQTTGFEHGGALRIGAQPQGGLFEREDPFASTNFNDAPSDLLRGGGLGDDPFAESRFSERDFGGGGLAGGGLESEFAPPSKVAREDDLFNRDDPFASTHFAAPEPAPPAKPSKAPPKSPPKRPDPLDAPPPLDDDPFERNAPPAPKNNAWLDAPPDDEPLPGGGGFFDPLGASGKLSKEAPPKPSAKAPANHKASARATAAAASIYEDEDEQEPTPGAPKAVKAAKRPAKAPEERAPVASPGRQSAAVGVVVKAAPAAPASNEGGLLQTISNLALIGLVLVVGFLGFVAWRNDGLLDFGALGDMTAAAFGQGTYTPRGAGEATPATAGPTKQAPQLPPVRVEGVKQSYFPNKKDQPLFLVEGQVVNHGDDTLKDVHLVGEVLDANGKPLATLQAPAGRAFIETELFEVTDEATLRAAYDAIRKESAELTLGPKQAMKFSLVFLGIPQDAQERRVKIELAAGPPSPPASDAQAPDAGQADPPEEPKGKKKGGKKKAP